MKKLLIKLFTPWNAGAYFETDEAFHAFLKKRHRLAHLLRMLLLIPAAVCLMLGYAVSEQPFYAITAGLLVLVLLLTLMLGKIEEILPGGDPS